MQPQKIPDLNHLWTADGCFQDPVWTPRMIELQRRAMEGLCAYGDLCNKEKFEAAVQRLEQKREAA
jgi:hypothetical protein